MKKYRKLALVLALSVCLVSALTLTACGGSGDSGEQDAVSRTVDNIGDTLTQTLQGDVSCEVGTTYSTKWFDFTVESLSTSTTYKDYTPAAGSVLVVVHVSLTNTFGSTQPFGTFDFFITADSLGEDYIYPIDPFADGMMPLNYNLADGESASYDVVIELPLDIASPSFTYIELDENGDAYATFLFAIE